MFLSAVLAGLLLPALAADAAEHEIRMLNSGSAGPMAFEPGFLRASPGDTIRFVATDRGHSVESIKGMLPDGAAAFKSKTSKDFVLTVDKPGVYGVKCAPHLAMGMVALIAVGDPSINRNAAEAVKLPGKAAERMKIAFAAMDNR